MKILSALGVLLSVISLATSAYLITLGMILRKEDPEQFGTMYDLYGTITAIGVIQCFISFFFLVYAIASLKKKR